MAKKNYMWYIEPLDSHTNVIIARQLPGENFETKFVKADNRCHPLWSCLPWFIRDLYRSSNHLNARFRVYSQVGQGQIRDCTFLYRKKQKEKSKRLPFKRAVFFLLKLNQGSLIILIFFT